MNSNPLQGFLRPNGGRETEKCILGLVRSSLAQRAQIPVAQINMDTKIPDSLVEGMLDEIGDIIDRTIPKRRKPRHGWRVSTFVGYIFNEQESFPIRNNTAQ